MSGRPLVHLSWILCICYQSLGGPWGAPAGGGGGGDAHCWCSHVLLMLPVYAICLRVPQSSSFSQLLLGTVAIYLPAPWVLAPASYTHREKHKPPSPSPCCCHVPSCALGPRPSILHSHRKECTETPPPPPSPRHTHTHTKGSKGMEGTWARAAGRPWRRSIRLRKCRCSPLSTANCSCLSMLATSASAHMPVGSQAPWARL